MDLMILWCLLLICLLTVEVSDLQNSSLYSSVIEIILLSCLNIPVRQSDLTIVWLSSCITLNIDAARHWKCKIHRKNENQFFINKFIGLSIENAKVKKRNVEWRMVAIRIIKMSKTISIHKILHWNWIKNAWIWQFYQ